MTYELMAERFDRLFGVKLTLDEVIRMACLIKMNWIEIKNSYVDSHEVCYAVAIYIDDSIKHDCRPSCYPWFYGRKMQVRAMRTIDTSLEEPTMAFIFVDKDRDTRREELLDNHLLRCQCKRCVTYDDKDMDFVRYEELANNVNASFERWDEFMEMQKQIFGERYPGMTYLLVIKMVSFEEMVDNKNQPMTPVLTKQWMDLVEEVEKELLITHGREHWDYKMIADLVSKVRQSILCKAFNFIETLIRPLFN